MEFYFIFFMDKFLAIILGLPAALLLVKYRRQVGDAVGPIDFAEQYLGSGGTYNLVLIIALLVFILSLMYGLGTLQPLLQGTLGKFF